MDKMQKHVYEIVEKNMTTINNIFALMIPATEIARISEIFIEYL